MAIKDMDLLPLQEAMDWLGVSRATIDRWRRNRNLPFIKIGKEIYMEKPKLQAWIQQHAPIVERESISPVAPASSERITIGYQSGAALLWTPLIIKQLGWFEEELHIVSPSTSYTVNWVNAPNGIELVEELIAGRVHIASVGDYPIMISQALSQILPKFKSLLLAFDGKTRNGGGISLVVPSGSSVQSLSDLASTTISTVANSSASLRLKGVMTSLGMGNQEIAFRQMGECLNGIVDRSVGASVMWEPYLSWAQSLGAGVTLFDEGMGDDYLTGLLADDRWAEQNEAVVIAYLKAHLRAHEFIRSQPATAAALISQASGFPVQLVTRIIASIRWDACLYSRDLRTLSSITPDNYVHPASSGQSRLPSIAANKPYLQYAVEALRLPILPDSLLPGDWSAETVY